MLLMQGMITNDVEKLKQGGHPVLYAAILNAQGRQLHDIFLHRDPSMQLSPDRAPNVQALLSSAIQIRRITLLLCHSLQQGS